MKYPILAMKYKVGSFVRVLVERDCAQEGDVGVVDAVHPDQGCYTIGFYAAEDCMVGSARFYEEELAPYKKEKVKAPFENGDIVETLIDNLNIPKGSEGEVIMVYPKTNAIAVKFLQKDGSFPIILPFAYDEARIITKHRFTH